MKIEDMDELVLFEALLWGEARGEPVEGQIAVACVVRNRVNNPKWWGESWRGVMLKAKQFSAFNEGNPNRVKIEAMDFSEGNPGIVVVQLRYIMRGVRYNAIRDNTKGANHYHTNRVSPKWSKGKDPTAQFGNHKFYKL